jgi:type IV secretory pathway VirB4 component
MDSSVLTTPVHRSFTKGGDLGTVIRLEGVDAECLDHPQIDQMAPRFETALRMFDEPGFHTVTTRTRPSSTPSAIALLT